MTILGSIEFTYSRDKLADANSKNEVHQSFLVVRVTSSSGRMSQLAALAVIGQSCGRPITVCSFQCSC